MTTSAFPDTYSSGSTNPTALDRRDGRRCDRTQNLAAERKQRYPDAARLIDY